MKIKVMRASGHPIELEKIEEYKQAWRELYDRIQDKCTLGKSANNDKAINMIRMQKLLARCEQSLMKQYNRVGEWEFLSTPEALSEKIDQFGNLMLTKRADSGDLLYVILDEDLVQG